MTRSDILDTAKQAITVDRNKTHGDAEDSFSSISKYWSAYLNRDITIHDVAVMMALMKIGRIEQNRDHQDHYVDACGYLAICGEFHNPILPKRVERCLEQPDGGGDMCGKVKGHEGRHCWEALTYQPQSTELEVRDWKCKEHGCSLVKDHAGMHRCTQP